MSVTISEKPWSDYTEADYTLEQWHNACLIHLHESNEDYTKADCKLPVRTPNGTINKNGVHAAASALAGARGGVKAPEEEKKKARAAIRRLYGLMDEEPPPSMNHSSVDAFLSHYGVKGMKWRQRKKAFKTVNGNSKTKRDNGEKFLQTYFSANPELYRAIASIRHSKSNVRKGV